MTAIRWNGRIAFALFLVGCGSGPGYVQTPTFTPLGPVPSRVLRMAFSPDGRHLALVTQRGEEFLVWLDGQAGPEYDDILSFAPARLTFDPDGALIFLVLNKDHNQTLGRVRIPPRPE